VTDSAAEDELFSSWGSFSRYPAMLGGTVAGQLVGIAIDAGVGSRTLWIPLACSVVLEALVAVRFGSRGGLPLDPRRCARVSWTYSLVLAGVSAPLLIWMAASHAAEVAGGVGYSFLTLPRLLGVLVVLAAATAARAGLMIALVTRRR
jgi:hypothetical protein